MATLIGKWMFTKKPYLFLKVWECKLNCVKFSFVVLELAAMAAYSNR